MPNPYYFRTVVNRLWRIANGTHPGDVSVRAVNALIKTFPPDVPRYVVVQQMLNAVDAYDYARHLLRDLYDHAQTSPSMGGAPQGAEGAAPALTEVTPAQAGAAPQEEETPEEDDDPL